MNENPAEDPPNDTASAPPQAAPELPPAPAEEEAEAASEAGAAAVAELSPAATAKRLAELFPALFGPEVKPIKLRIHADIQQRAPGIFTRKSLSVFLHRHTTSTAYLKALVASPTRFDLDGVAAGEAAEEHREAARTELARRRQLAEVRRVAERQAARAAAQETARVEHERHREQMKAERQQRKEAAREWERKKAEGLAADVERERQRADAEAHSQERRDRTALLRAWETTTLTRANFLALKRLSSEQFDEQIALARAEAKASFSQR
jgi:sRNA-binding protein